MNSLREFCSKLEMPKEVTEKILALRQNGPLHPEKNVSIDFE